VSYRLASETGALKQVLLHRPGRELTRLTPRNKDDLLFDDLLWLDRAQAEHDAFAEVLRSRGAEVLYFQELLTETLRVREARDYVLCRVIDERIFGPEGVEALRGYTDALPVDGLAEFLVAGMTKRELLDLMPEPNSMDTKFMGLDDFVLNPLPNHLFTRDTTCWVYDGVAINSMSKPARQRETISYEAIYRWHPAFADAGFHLWGNGIAEGRSTVEGGDVLVIGNGAVLVGLSERTAAMGAERLARRLFKAGSATTVVCVQMPKERALMHLDTVMTMVDEESFVRYPLFGDRPTWVLTPGQGESIAIDAHGSEDFTAVIARALGLPAIRLLTPPYDGIAAEREQWNDGCNVLAIAPGVVVGYDRNVRTSDFLRANGVEVLDVPGSELGRGRGGPRCMSCPTLREN
jgi:arginine deiminase